MKLVYSDKHAQHDPQSFVVRGTRQRSTEQPERATRLLAAAIEAGHQVVAPRGYGSAGPRRTTWRQLPPCCAAVSAMPC